MIIKSQSNKVAPKCKVLEVETFLSRIGQDIFSDTLQNKYKTNISTAEKQALNKWMDNMDNADNEFFLRIHYKGNRFIFVDEKTNKEKTNEQTGKSNF